MNKFHQDDWQLDSRRRALKKTACGFGWLAFQALVAEQSMAQSPGTGAATDAANRGETSLNPLAPRESHFQPRAKRVIFMNMDGGPSSQETFDYKPGSSIFKFQKHGHSGLFVSELFPNLAGQIDKVCLLQGMHCDSPDHINAAIQLHCGKHLSSRPSMGSWVTYGLGSENEDLPGFVILNPSSKGGGTKLYGNAFLPAMYAGTPIGQSLELSDTTNSRLGRDVQREFLDRVQSRNRELMVQYPQDPQLSGILNSYELGFRMQSALPELLDVTKEPRSTLDAYGIGKKPTDNFGRQCLAARRMCEAGVRFIELTHSTWDHHSALARLLPERCREIDQPAAALLNDLAERGLLKDTVVLWGGEFGRLKTETKKDGGSGHNNKGYTMWMSGGGVKGGFAYGQTDEDGLEAISGRVHIHDLHATLLHLLGLDHERLTYHFAGRDFRLTDTKGHVAKAILA